MVLLKILNVSERTRMSVVPRSSDVFVEQKLASRSVHGGTLLDRLFSKGLRQVYFQIENIRHIYCVTLPKAYTEVFTVHSHYLPAIFPSVIYKKGIFTEV